MLHVYQDNPVGGVDQLNSLHDVNISNPENKQIIYYDNTTGTWRNYDPPFVDRDDILHTIEECTASTDPNDVAGASAVSALNSAIGVVDNRISKNHVTDGNRVSITSYNSSSNRYTCPSDGYITLNSNGAGSIIQANYNGIVITAMGYTSGNIGGWDNNALFVRAGAKIFIATNTGNNNAWFYPLLDSQT